jgi:ATP synthase F1 gamma subunit
MQFSNYANQQRLENIKALKPMLASLRTISLSNWKSALKKSRSLEKYLREFNAAVGGIAAKPADAEQQTAEDAIVVLLGSSRGLCGGFNRDLLAFYEEQSAFFPAAPSRTILFGERLKTLYIQKFEGEPILMKYPKINELQYSTVKILINEIKKVAPTQAITIVYNAYSGAGKFHPGLQSFNRTIEITSPDKKDLPDNLIIDSDIDDLIEFVNEHSFINSIYRTFLSSLAAEHSARFQIMESAITNIDNLIQELTIMVQVERRRKVTSEMRELSIGAGLLEQGKSQS